MCKYVGVFISVVNIFCMNSITLATNDSASSEDMDLIIRVAIIVIFMEIFYTLFYKKYQTLIKRKKSRMKGGIFYEEKEKENRKDYKYLRTHHILTKNNYSLSDIQAIDEYFDEDRFLLFAKKIFLKHQYAWAKFDMEMLKTIETTSLFYKHSNMLNELRENKQVNVIDKISVHSANICLFFQDETKDYLDVLLNASMIEYLMSEATGEILDGDKEFKINVTYKMRFERRKGTKTKKDTEKMVKNIEIKDATCPNCGAPLDPKLYGWCEYCMGIDEKEESWILSEIEFFED